MTKFTMMLMVVAVCATLSAARLHAGNVQDACGGVLQPTVTFLTSCATIDVTDAACWTPHAPTSGDVVAFPTGTSATMPFAMLYTPLSVASVLVASGASVTMQGAAIAVSACLQVSGTLILDPGYNVDNGTSSTIPFAADPSVPLGTDCQVINQGFSPRICGPGEAYVMPSGLLSIRGLFASLWASTVVAAGGTLQFDDESFLWGEVNNFGSITANMRTFFHGELTNQGGASASFTMLRPDFWTTTPGTQNVTLSILNYGVLSFSEPIMNGDANYDLISTKDNDSMPFVTLQITNHQTLNFNGPRRGSNPNEWTNTWLIEAVDIINYGTTNFRGRQDFSSSGSASNYGIFAADVSQVWVQNYVSNGGTEQTTNGGSFEMGISQVRADQLKARGVRGPYISTASFTNSKVTGDGSLRIHEPIAVHGTLSIGTHVTLENRIAFRSSALRRDSDGILELAGKYVAGKEELVEDRHSQMKVLRSGTVVVPKSHRLALRDDAKFEVHQGAMLHIDGVVKTVAHGADRRVDVHSKAFTTGVGKMEGDFSLDVAHMEL